MPRSCSSCPQAEPKTKNRETLKLEVKKQWKHIRLAWLIQEFVRWGFGLTEDSDQMSLLHQMEGFGDLLSPLLLQTWQAEGRLHTYKRQPKRGHPQIASDHTRVVPDSACCVCCEASRRFFSPDVVASLGPLKSPCSKDFSEASSLASRPLWNWKTWPPE